MIRCTHFYLLACLRQIKEGIMKSVKKLLRKILFFVGGCLYKPWLIITKKPKFMYYQAGMRPAAFHRWKLQPLDAILLSLKKVLRENILETMLFTVIRPTRNRYSMQ